MTPATGANRRIVLGDDLSSGADLAWLWVNSQQWSGWELVVLTANTPPFGPPVSPERAEPHPIEGPPRRTVFDEPGFGDVRFLTAEADPRIVLHSYDDVALVVVGAAGEEMGRWQIGSTTEWLLHGPPSPLLVARTGRPVRRALVCADGSEHASHSARALAAMPWAGDVDVTGVAVEDGRSDTGAAAAEVEGVLGAGGITASVVVRSGTPHREIIAEGTARDVDLIVLGTRGLSRFQRFVLGSTASAVTRRAAASVLVSSAEGAE